MFRAKLQLLALGSSPSYLAAFCCAPAELAVLLHPGNRSLLTPKVPINTFPLASLFLGNFQSIKPQHSHLFWDSPSQSLASFAKPCPVRAVSLIVLCPRPPL